MDLSNIAKPVQIVGQKWKTQVQVLSCGCTDCLTKKVNKFLDERPGLMVNAIQYSSFNRNDGDSIEGVPVFSAMIVWTENV